MLNTNPASSRPDRMPSICSRLGRRTKLQLGFRLPLPELLERIRDDAMPGRVLREANAQCPRLTSRHASGACARFAHLLKNAPRIFQVQPTGGAQLHAARQPVEQLEPQLGFQVLNLRGQKPSGPRATAVPRADSFPLFHGLFPRYQHRTLNLTINTDVRIIMRSMAVAACQDIRFDRPIYRTLPCRTRSLRVRNVSSSGVLLSHPCT
jgi:hypothetical protein